MGPNGAGKSTQNCSLVFGLYDNVVGTFFLTQIEKAIKEMDFKKIILLTDRNVPAYNFSEEIC